MGDSGQGQDIGEGRLPRINADWPPTLPTSCGLRLSRRGRLSGRASRSRACLTRCRPERYIQRFRQASCYTL